MTSRQHMFDELEILRFKPFFHKLLSYFYCFNDISMVKCTCFDAVWYTSG